MKIGAMGCAIIGALKHNKGAVCGFFTHRKTQGGACMLGGCCVKSWSSTQALIATSSAEAEYYGIVKAASVGLGVQATLSDMGFKFNLEVITDASAAKAIASRLGLGKTRHISVHYLWVQERVKCGDLVIKKCWGGENPADHTSRA